MTFSNHHKPNYDLENGNMGNEPPSSAWASGIALLVFITIANISTARRIDLWVIALWIIFVGLWLRSISVSARGVSAKSNLKERQAHTSPSEPEPPPMAMTADPLEIAHQAVRRAGNEPDAGKLRLQDIGLLTYDGGSRPTVNRVEIIPATVTHLRPFVVIDLFGERESEVALKIELVKEGRPIRFVTDERVQIQQGKNYFVSRTWLLMSDDDMGGAWSLRVSVDDQLLALHTFTVTPDVGAAFRAYLRSDGEIDEWLSKSAANAPTEQLSLEELLRDQRSNRS